MTIITEGNLTFSFENSCQASKYDDWSFYKNQFQSIAGGSKGVDILCVENDTSWLIEIKDYRESPRVKTINISNEVANKVRDTLAGLAAAAKVANDADERDLAKKALATSRWKVVVHVEQSERKPIIPANLFFRFSNKKLLKAIDPRPFICDRSITNKNNGIPWKVQ